jgi:TonB family protein
MNLFIKDRSKYSFALIFSLVLHTIVFGYFLKNTQNEVLTNPQVENKLPAVQKNIMFDSVKVISREQLQAAKEKNRQIVANETNENHIAPVESRFAGEKNQSFDRQTISSKNGAFKKAGLGIKEGIAESKVQSKEVLVKKVVAAEKIKTGAKNLTLSALGNIEIVKIEDEERLQREALEEMNQKQANENKKVASLGIARGNASESGLSQNNDFVEDVPLGDMTNLNTTEFKYYGFYHRIRQKLEQYWGSTIQSKAKKLYKSGRRMPTSNNLITAVTVTLDDHGQILEIKIDGTSGIRELDQAAIESFNKAGPFPNPPKGLLIGGRAVIQWGFVVKS